MLIILNFMKILATARRNRITFGTQMNQHSSRSHALLCITVQGTDLATGSKTTGQSHIMHFSFYTGKVHLLLIFAINLNEILAFVFESLFY